MGINVDLSDEHIDLIVESIKKSISLNQDNMEKVLTLEDIVWALGRGDEL